MRKIAITMALMIFPLCVFLGPATAGGPYKAEGMTQTEMNFESKHEAEVAEKELVKKIAWVENRLYNEHLENFRKAQKAWEEYRKLQCDALYEEYKDGSISPLIVNGCYTGITNARKKVLDDQYMMHEGIAPKVDDE